MTQTTKLILATGVSLTLIFGTAFYHSAKADYSRVQEYCQIYGSLTAYGFQAGHEGESWSRLMEHADTLIDRLEQMGLYYSGTPQDVRRGLTAGHRQGQQYDLNPTDLQATMNFIQHETMNQCLETAAENLD